MTRRNTVVDRRRPKYLMWHRNSKFLGRQSIHSCHWIEFGNRVVVNWKPFIPLNTQICTLRCDHQLDVVKTITSSKAGSLRVIFYVNLSPVMASMNIWTNE
jgi:hypothetical protein